MKKIVFAILTFHLVLSSTASGFESQNLEALNFIRQLFSSDLDVAVIKEMPSLPYFAFTTPHENIIQIRPNMRETQRKIHLVHEYTHRLRYKKNTQDDRWFAEGLSQMAEYLYSGWPFLYNDLLLQNADLKVSNNQVDYLSGSRAYANSFFLMYYLYSHFGDTKLLLKMMNSSRTGWDNITESIAELQSQKVIPYKNIKIDRAYIIRHFAVALAVNDVFIAEYSLFHLHPTFTPIFKKSFIDGAFSDVENHDFQIVFSRSEQVKGLRSSDLVYSIKSMNPFRIQRGKVPDSELYIFIRQ